MGRWLLTQLGRGKIPGSDKRLFADEQSQQMWTGAVTTPIPHYPPEFAVAQPNYNLYALGWDLSDYRGAQVVGHDGAVLGSQATIALLPEKNVGIFIAVNSEDGEIIRGLLYELLDHYLGPAPEPMAGEVARVQARPAQPGGKAGQDGGGKTGGLGPRFRSTVMSATIPTPGTERSRSARRARASTVDFPHSSGMEGPLTHYQYDTFKTNPRLELGRAGLRHILDRRRWQGRPGDDEARLAHRRFQLGLSGPALHARKADDLAIAT